MSTNNQDGQWVTIKGRHILIKDGESFDEALARSQQEKKDRDIQKAKEVADKLNAERAELDKSRKATATIKTQAEHAQAVKELASDKYEDGTYDIVTKKPVEFSKGYQVTFCQIGDDYSPQEYAKKVNECLKMSSDGKTYAGKFESTPEISFHCNSRAEAIKYAKANNQISIWDWGNCDQILTGGTGTRKKKGE